MTDQSRALQRIKQLEELLDIEYDKLHDLEKQLALQPPGPGKTAIKQTIKRENWPTIRAHEKELGEHLAEVADPAHVPDAEAAVLCSELASEVSSLEAAKKDDWPEDVRQGLAEIQQKLNEPSKAAAAKLKVSLPIIPLLMSYELELDTESTLVQTWRKIKSLFQRGLPGNP